MKKWLFTLALCLIVPASVETRQHGMHVAVVDGRINIGAEFTPRCANVTAGTLAAGTYGCVEVETALTIPAVEVKIQTLIVLPGATLTVDCGATIIGRNVAIDTKADPFTWGNGLLNFGTLKVCGEAKTPFVALAGSAPSGATSLTLASDPVGWAAGDELVLPDTRQMGQGVTPTREKGATIAAINGRTVTLSKPLAFARNSITRPDGSVVLAPRVANITRRTTIKSESATGTRWHIASVGGAASWDIRGVALEQLGRTRNEPLNSTPATDTTRIGTNQVGRYFFHMHHASSSLAVRRFDSNAVVGATNGGKWGVIVHQTHDTEITNNACVDIPGSCFATEDGNEVRNNFTGNFAAYVTGNGGPGVTDALANTSRDCRGCESAFWFNGVQNIIDGNEAWNSQSSIDLFNRFHLANGSAVPSVKGGAPDTVLVLANLTPISSKNNVTASNTDSGYEYWSVPRFANENLISAHNGLKQVWNGQADTQSDIFLVDPILIGGGTNNQSGCIASSKGYNTGVETLRGEARGCSVGIAGGIGQVYGRFTDTVFQNRVNFHFEPDWPPVTLTNVRFERLGALPASNFNVVPVVGAWAGPPAPFPGELRPWTEFDGKTLVLNNHNGTGKNFRIVYPGQARNALTWRSSDPMNWMLPPKACGTTLGENWDLCGMGYNGQPFTPGTEQALEGLNGMVAVPEPMLPLGVPKAILTSPNGYDPAVPRPDYGILVLSIALTGDNTKADNHAYFTITRDGVTSRIWDAEAFQPNMVAARGVDDHNVPGQRTVRLWRQLSGKEVPGSSMTFTYCVGSTCEGAPPPPPPPPPPVDKCKEEPLVPTVTVTATGHQVTWSGTITASDERGCKGTVSQ